jgi:molecular chaperone GrpE
MIMDQETSNGKPGEGRDSGITEALVPEALTSEQIEDLKTRAARADDNWNRLLRATADLENYKKRAQREREEAIRNAGESIIRKLLPVLDGFDAALAAVAQDKKGSAESLQAGVTMIQQQFQKALQEAGVEEVDALGKVFDPNFHEAVAQQDNTEVPEGQVVQQLRKGYRLRERLIRPASVVVARKPGS